MFANSTILIYFWQLLEFIPEFLLQKIPCFIDCGSRMRHLVQEYHQEIIHFLQIICNIVANCSFHHVFFFFFFFSFFFFFFFFSICFDTKSI